MENKVITLAHGNGGRLMHELVDGLRARFSNKALDELTDAAELRLGGARLAFSADSYVVKPIFFPGGDIGKLAVCGTVNDISMKGAKPLFISLALIIEEGFSFPDFGKITDSAASAARSAGVEIVTGDIKVVENGSADKIFINTAGIGAIEYKGRITSRAKAGDLVMINGPIAEHGMAILNARENLGFKSAIKSDCRNLNHDVQRCLKASNRISVMRDPTRGGLATALNEIAAASGLGIEIDEKKVPIRPAVKKFCALLGFDPLYVANEGKFLCFVPERDAARVMRAMGPGSAMIGRVTKTHKGEVNLTTSIGTSRPLPMLETDQLPRIC